MWLCKKNFKKTKEPEDSKFRLSIMMDREKKRSVESMNLFVAELNKRCIFFEKFTSGNSMFTYNLKYRDRYSPFNICVDEKYKEDVLETHKNIYGF